MWNILTFWKTELSSPKNKKFRRELSELEKLLIFWKMELSSHRIINFLIFQEETLELDKQKISYISLKTYFLHFCLTTGQALK